MNYEAVAKVHNLIALKNRQSAINLVADDRMLKRYVTEIQKAALDIIDLAEKPMTIIYDEAQNLANNLIADDGTIAIRIPNDDFCYELTRKFNGAVASAPAVINKNQVPKSFKEIDNKFLKGVDYIVNLHRENIIANPASIIRLKNNGEVKIVRA